MLELIFKEGEIPLYYEDNCKGFNNFIKICNFLYPNKVTVLTSKNDEKDSLICILFDKIDITNSSNVKHTIHDIYFCFHFDNYDIYGLRGFRTTLNYFELIQNYQHSHLDSIRYSTYDDFFLNFFNNLEKSSWCFGSDLRNLLYGISQGICGRSYEDIIKALLQIPDYLSWESLEGGPYHKISLLQKDASKDGIFTYKINRRKIIEVFNSIVDTDYFKTAISKIDLFYFDFVYNSVRDIIHYDEHRSVGVNLSDTDLKKIMINSLLELENKENISLSEFTNLYSVWAYNTSIGDGKFSKLSPESINLLYPIKDTSVSSTIVEEYTSIVSNNTKAIVEDTFNIIGDYNIKNCRYVSKTNDIINRTNIPRLQEFLKRSYRTISPTDMENFRSYLKILFIYKFKIL